MEEKHPEKEKEMVVKEKEKEKEKGKEKPRTTGIMTRGQVTKAKAGVSRSGSRTTSKVIGVRQGKVKVKAMAKAMARAMVDRSSSKINSSKGKRTTGESLWVCGQVTEASSTSLWRMSIQEYTTAT